MLTKTLKTKQTLRKLSSTTYVMEADIESRLNLEFPVFIELNKLEKFIESIHKSRIHDSLITLEFTWRTNPEEVGYFVQKNPLVFKRKIRDYQERKRQEGQNRAFQHSVMSTLIYLGIINSKYKPLPVWGVLRTSKYRNVLGELIVIAYHKIFTELPDAPSQPDDALQDLFLKNCKASLWQVDIMIRTFKALCDIADFSSVDINGIISEINQPHVSINSSAPHSGIPDRTADPPRSIFIAHIFNDTGFSYFEELEKFLKLLDFEVKSGEKYSPDEIPIKIKKRIQECNIFIVIFSETNDPTWLQQELTFAHTEDKATIILTETGFDFKAGMIGSREPIEFPDGQISESYVKILEGFTELGYKFSTLH